MALGDFADVYGYAIKLSQRDSPLAADVAAAKQAVNNVYYRICDEAVNFDFLQSQGTLAMVVGQEPYSFTTIGAALSITCTHVIDLGHTFTGAGDLMYVTWDDYQSIRSINPALANGIPAVWTMSQDSQILLWPKPNATTAINVLAQKLPVELVADGDVPFIPIQYRRELLGKGAAIELLLQDGGYENMVDVQAMEADYEKSLERLRQAHGLEGPMPRPNPSSVIELPVGLLGTAGSFLDIAQRVCRTVGLKPWSAYDLDRAKEAVNSTYLMVCGDEDQWSFLEGDGQITLQAGADTYTVASIASALSITAGLNEILALVNDTTGSGPIMSTSWQELEALAESTQDAGEARGEPLYWTKWATRLRLWPSPDQAYKVGVFYRLQATALVNDTDTFLIPADMVVSVLVPGAAARLLRQSRVDKKDRGNDIALGDRLEADFKDHLAVMRRTYAANREPTFTAISPTFHSTAGLGGEYQGWV